MALSINDLDALLQYDPASHSVSGFPKPRTDFPADQSQLPPAVRQAAAPGIISDINSTQPAKPQVSDRIPSLAPTAPDLGQNGATPSPTVGGIPAIGTQLQQGQDTQLQKPKLSGWDKLKGGLAKAANIAGDVLAPEVMPLIPGTDLNKVWQQNREAKLAGENARDWPHDRADGRGRGDIHGMRSIRERNKDFETWEKQNPNEPRQIRIAAGTPKNSASSERESSLPAIGEDSTGTNL